MVQPVVFSIQRDTARAANTMARCASIDSRVWWKTGRHTDQFAAVFNWNSPAGTRRTPRRTHLRRTNRAAGRTFDNPEDAEAWFAQLRADRWSLAEPDVADFRRANPGLVVATVGLFRPFRPV